MPKDGWRVSTDGLKPFKDLTLYPRRESGKSIRRQLERRFDAVLSDIARRDPTIILQWAHARWLLDNSHLVRQSLQQIENDLPSSYHRQLPTVHISSGIKVPRVFALIDQAIDRSGLPIECGSVERFCRDYQSAMPSATRLTLGELWAVPIALRITLLTRLCKEAEICQKEATKNIDAEGDTGSAAIVAGCITSLRTVATFNWPDFVEKTSAVEHALRRDPSGFYRRMDFATRDHYRGVVERISHRTTLEQWEVAQAALRLAMRAERNGESLQRRHVGYYLIDEGLPQLEREVRYRLSPGEKLGRPLSNHRAGLYLLAITGLAACGSFALTLGLLADNAGPSVSAAAALIALIPLLSVSSGTVNLIASLMVPPRRLPKLDYASGIPADRRAIVVVPMLLSSAQDIAENLANLEQNYLGNADPQLCFALLSDFTDAANADTPQDKPLLDQAIDGIEQLNRRYQEDGNEPFALFHRRRLWNKNAQRWMGWERKRGKLEEFNDLLRGATDTSFVVQHGASYSPLDDIRYVITLDADTYMPTGAAARLVGTMAHPLNRPCFDDQSQRVVRGYTVIQPRLGTNPVTGVDTLFARIFAGDVMLDLYTNAVSDVYQDLFGDAVFAGKGIYDLDAFRRSVSGKVLENTVLSHDLLEGLLGRAGLASDIVLLENYPPNFLAYVQRLHRWVRGDWQLLSWLFAPIIAGKHAFNPGMIGLWKLFDNLRRSLFTPAILSLLFLGWIWLPGNPVFWTLLFALFPGLPVLVRLTLALRTSLWRWGTIESSLRNLAGHAGADLARWLLALVFLPAEAYAVADAVLRTIYRVTLSHRKLLEWSTAAQVSRGMGASGKASVYWRRLWIGPAMATGTFCAILAFNPNTIFASSTLLLSWFLSPLIAQLLSQAVKRRAPLGLRESEVQFIRGIARDTWRFFERFVGPETSWLPPDNVQENPQRTIAERTSPTNIGMMLLATLTAYDLGYLGQRQLLSRLTSHLRSIQQLRKHRGHLFNWYSTRDLQPLKPLYVSTVDSGNLVTALIILKQALEDLPHDTQTIERSVLALADELTALRRALFPDETQPPDRASRQFYSTLETAQKVLSDASGTQFMLRKLERELCGEIDREFLQSVQGDPQRWSAEEIANFRKNSQVFRQRVHMISADMDLFAPWLERIDNPPAPLLEGKFLHRWQQLFSALGLSPGAQNVDQRLEAAAGQTAELLSQLSLEQDTQANTEANDWLEALRGEIEGARRAVRARDETRQELLRISATLIENTDFQFLYDRNRNLFHVGYNASTGEVDSSYYDLLASEARMASFVAIAEGNIPAKHWMYLGRPLTRIRGLRILLSWSATAFEYLMPRLFMHNPVSGLLNQSCEGVVREQIRFGRDNSIPWGISESGYAQLDSQGHYQYYAFGIPKLGLKWDQGERLVVSPYASALAMPYAPRETAHNLRRLVNFRAYGQYGLYEALDFGDAHKAHPGRPQVVQSYMAHHQGMILVAIGNALCNDRMLQRFHRDPRIASVEYLLYERLPQRIHTRPLERLPAPLKRLPGATTPVAHWRVDPDEPELAVLSNGHLSSRVSDQGGSALFWHGMAVTRWDTFRSGTVGGSRVYLKDLDHDLLWNVGAEPLDEGVETIFAPHTVEFRERHGEMLMRMTVTVAPVEDVEVRRISITNDGPHTRNVMLASYSEPVLARESADRRHLTFSKLFIESWFLNERNALLFRRRPRESDEPSFYFAHAAVASANCEVSRGIEIDRRAFLGRHGNPANPAALSDPAYRFSSTAHPTLDPCAAIAVTVRIPARSTIHCTFLSSVGESRANTMDALKSYQSLERIGWVAETARLQSERELTAMHVHSELVQASFRLLARILWPPAIPHIGNASLNSVHRVQGSLWPHGISGDRPIVTLRVEGEEDLGPAENLLQSLDYLGQKDFAVDAVFLDESMDGYASPVRDRLRKLVELHAASRQDHEGLRAYIVPARNISAGEKSNLIAAARVFIDSRARSTDSRFTASNPRWVRMPAFIPQPSAPLSSETIAPVTRAENMQYENSLGGLLPGNDGYSLLLSTTSPQTPAPWCNILTNPGFGTLVSESGSMFTWWANSSENRLTQWSNDPVLDETSEAVYIRDEETGISWSLTPQPRPDGAPYRVTHSTGKTLFEHNSQGLEQRLQVFVDIVEPVKILRVSLTNRWPRVRRLTVTFAAEWLLGNSHGFAGHLLLPERDSETGSLLIRQGFTRHAGDELAFVGSSLPAHGVSCDGKEFFGKRRSWAAPAALAAVGLSDRVEPNAQTCAAYQVHLNLQPDQSDELHFILGAAENRQAAATLMSQSRNPAWVDERLKELDRRWSHLLGAWQVATPDPAADAMINHWLLYQVIASRLWGRIGFYQASGGFGFRDQLQDVLALLDTEPELARQHILIAASRQFEEGDVLHWWHEGPLRGVRTRCSDDLLWLPYAVAEYVVVTGDHSILRETAAFLEGEPLKSDELERYAEYHAGPHATSLYHHCCRAIDARITFGAHGMPFIGTGDWNDGLNRVGESGRGESVWMAWFLVVVCRCFAPLCRQMGEHDRADRYQTTAADLLQLTQKTAWAGTWYLRGYFDDGTPLGAPGDAESEIDLNAQTWAVLADREHPAARQAMQAAAAKLVDKDHRLIKLLAPPFENTAHDPGYIRAYPPGVRENGGQYTHAAVWAAWAAADLGDRANALRWFEWLNPLKRSGSDQQMQHYLIEPYVTPGDIYGVGELAGRGGWSWYTGSAAWLYRFAIQKLLGLQRRGEFLFVRPCLPQSWPQFQATFRFKDAEYHLRVHDPMDIQPDELFLVINGAVVDGPSIILEASGQHVCEVFASDTARRRWLAEQRQESDPGLSQRSGSVR